MAAKHQTSVLEGTLPAPLASYTTTTSFCVTLRHPKSSAASPESCKQDRVQEQQGWMGQLRCLSWLFAEHRRERLGKQKHVWMLTYTPRQGLKLSGKHSFQSTFELEGCQFCDLFLANHYLLWYFATLAWAMYVTFACIISAYVKSEMAARRQSHGQDKYSGVFVFFFCHS